MDDDWENPFGGMDVIDEVDPEENDARTICERCERPKNVCLCASFPPEKFDTECHVIILMHPLEVKRKIRTAALLKHSINKCDIVVSRSIRPFMQGGSKPNLSVIAALAEPESTCYLFPGQSAVDLSNSQHARDTKQLPASIKYLIVLDGTWNQTREMFNRNKQYFSSLLQVQFTKGIGRQKDGRSEYVVRREPTANCVCTLEATVACLCALEPKMEAHRYCESLFVPTSFPVSRYWH
jgi:DTW domain-containing protein YfiP